MYGTKKNALTHSKFAAHFQEYLEDGCAFAYEISEWMDPDRSGHEIGYGKSMFFFQAICDCTIWMGNLRRAGDF